MKQKVNVLMECDVKSLQTSIDKKMITNKKSSGKVPRALCMKKENSSWLCILCNHSSFASFQTQLQVTRVSCMQVKMAAFMVRTVHLHFNQVFLPTFTNTCPSYEFLTTLLINLTMEGTLSESNNQLCRQVNKGVLGNVHQYHRDKETAVGRLSSCLDHQSCVHKIEITRDKTAW